MPDKAWKKRERDVAGYFRWYENAILVEAMER